MTKRSTVDSKDYMAEALLFLMKRKPAAKITVSEITERAGVSRATWFRHFTDKREAVVYGLARLWEKWAESHGLTDSHRPSVENVESFVDYILSRRRSNGPRWSQPYWTRMSVCLSIRRKIQGRKNISGIKH